MSKRNVRVGSEDNEDLRRSRSVSLDVGKLTLPEAYAAVMEKVNTDLHAGFTPFKLMFQHSDRVVPTTKYTELTGDDVDNYLLSLKLTLNHIKRAGISGANQSFREWAIDEAALETARAIKAIEKDASGSPMVRSGKIQAEMTRFTMSMTNLHGGREVPNNQHVNAAYLTSRFAVAKEQLVTESRDKKCRKGSFLGLFSDADTQRMLQEAERVEESMDRVEQEAVTRVASKRFVGKLVGNESPKKKGGQGDGQVRRTAILPNEVKPKSNFAKFCDAMTPRSIFSSCTTVDAVKPANVLATRRERELSNHS